MIDREKVLEEFGRMTGLSQEELAGWQDLCGSCARQLEKRLRAGADSSDPALPAAAAAMACYRWLLQQEGSGTVQVGSVRVQEGDRLERARLLEQEYLALCGGLLVPQWSALLGTEG